MCVFSIEIKNTELIVMKFGVEVILKERGFWGWVRPVPLCHGYRAPKGVQIDRLTEKNTARWIDG